MPKYTLELKSSAAKELDALDNSLFYRIDARILELAGEPRPRGCKKLKGYKDYWRIRIGDYRVIYILDDTARTVIVTRIAHRSEIYD